MFTRSFFHPFHLHILLSFPHSHPAPFPEKTDTFNLVLLECILVKHALYFERMYFKFTSMATVRTILLFSICTQNSRRAVWGSRWARGLPKCTRHIPPARPPGTDTRWPSAHPPPQMVLERKTSHPLLIKPIKVSRRRTRLRAKLPLGLDLSGPITVEHPLQWPLRPRPHEGEELPLSPQPADPSLNHLSNFFHSKRHTETLTVLIFIFLITSGFEHHVTY